jgi:hypothetical protein
VIRERLERAFLAPAGPRLLSATRVILAAQALWILLSRPDLPRLAEWPAVFWSHVEPSFLARFALGPLPLALEQARFLLLLAALVLTLAGVWPRVSGAVAACLLYQVAPMEEALVGIPHTSFGGLTVPTIGLWLLAFAEPPRGDAHPSPEFRWPVALTRLVFAFSYLFPLLAKLRFSGPDWFTAENMRNWVWMNQPLTDAGGGAWVASSPLLCGAVALGTLALELLFVLAVFSRRAALVLVPAAACFHAGIALVLGYFYTSLPLLLLFVEWDVIRARRGATLPDAAAASAAP